MERYLVERESGNHVNWKMGMHMYGGRAYIYIYQTVLTNPLFSSLMKGVGMGSECEWESDVLALL